MEDSMNQYVMIDVAHSGFDQKLNVFAKEVNYFLFVLFTEEDLFTFREAALALGLALDERHGGEPMQITLDTLPNGYVLIAKNGNPSEIVLASFREIRGHYEAKKQQQ